MNLRWSWDEPTRDLFRWVDPDAWEAMSHDPVRLLGQVPPRAPATARPPIPASCATSSRPTTSSTATSPTPAGSRPGRDPQSSPLRLVGLLLARVRHLRGPAAVLGRPRRARRRPPEGVERPRRPARRRRPLLPPRLLPPAASAVDGMAAGALLRARPVRAWRSRCCDGVRVTRRPGRRAAARPRCGGPTSAARRCTSSTPTSTTTPPDGRAGHRPALRRRHRAPHPPGDPPRHRRRAGPAGARPRRRRCSTPTRATPASSAWSGCASWWPDGLTLRRGGRGRARRLRLHDPHAGARPASTASPRS